VLAILGSFLRTRGWTLQRVGFVPSWRDSAAGAALAVVYYLSYALLWLTTWSLWPAIGALGGATHLVGSDLQWPAVLLVCAVNPVFEELFLCGYVISALRDSRGVTTAINVSAAIRVFCHFYQGAVGVVAIVPMALLFAYWYARSGRLWPLIVAHAILDLAALIPYLS
jgi:membrane protease YdiL (CAAX protease family)